MVNWGAVAVPAVPFNELSMTPLLGQGEPGAAHEFASVSASTRNARALSAVLRNQGVATGVVPAGTGSFGMSFRTLNLGFATVPGLLAYAASTVATSWPQIAIEDFGVV